MWSNVKSRSVLSSRRITYVNGKGRPWEVSFVRLSDDGWLSRLFCSLKANFGVFGSVGWSIRCSTGCSVRFEFWGLSSPESSSALLSRVTWQLAAIMLLRFPCPRNRKSCLLTFSQGNRNGILSNTILTVRSDFSIHRPFPSTPIDSCLLSCLYKPAEQTCWDLSTDASCYGEYHTDCSVFIMSPGIHWEWWFWDGFGFLDRVLIPCRGCDRRWFRWLDLFSSINFISFRNRTQINIIWLTHSFILITNQLIKSPKL